MIDTASAWDRHVDHYLRLGAPCTGYLAQSLFLSVAGRLPSGARILDIACGTGTLTRAAALHLLEDARATGDRGTVVATDISPEMVARTEKGLRALGADKVARCEVQDGQALTLGTSSFDAAFSAFGIFLFPDRLAGWREAARVLRRGGIFATAVWRGPEHNGLARQMAPVMEVLPERIRASLPPPAWFEVASKDGLVNEIGEAGFVEAEVSVMDAVLTAPTPRAMWDMMRDNPVSSRIWQDCSAEELAVIERSVLKNFEDLAGAADRPVRFDASCHFLVARRA